MSEKITVTERMLASSTGAIMTAVFMTPFDVVKIRLQAQQKEFLKNKCFLYCNGLMDHVCYCPTNGNSDHWLKRQTQFKGTTDALMKIARNEGLASLWSGLPPTLVMAVPATVVYFTTYDTLRSKIQREKIITDTAVSAMVCGAFARILTATTISPLELIRTKMQSQRLTYREITIAVQEMVRLKGVGSLYLGLSSTLLRDVPFSSIYWACYELLRKSFVPSTDQPTLQFCLIAGALSGTGAAVVTLPFDVVKTYRQIELGEAMTKADSQVKGTFQMLAHIYRTSGVRGMFSGLVPRIVKTAPACAIMISTYEMFKIYFANRKHQQSG